MRRILHAHPAISIPPESEDLLLLSTHSYLEHQHDHRSLISAQQKIIGGMACMNHWKLNKYILDEEWNDVLSKKEGLPSFYAAIYRAYAKTNKPSALVHGDKTPLLIWYTDLLRILYPEVLIIHLVRHPLDAISSLITLNSMKGDLEKATKRWKSSARSFLSETQISGNGRSVGIKYETLVNEPEVVTRQLCGLLELPFHPAMINDRSSDLGDTILAHHAGVSRAVNTASIGIWRSRLTTQQADYIRRHCAPEAHELGYTL